jgi:hypothetical protein
MLLHSLFVFCICSVFIVGVLALPGNLCRTNSIADPYRCFVNMNCDGMNITLLSFFLLYLTRSTDVEEEISGAYADPIAGDDSWSGNKVCYHN